MSPWLAVLLFAFATAVDVLWVKYTLAVTDGHALRAASLGGLIYVFGAVGTVNYVHDLWYLGPLVAGAFTGTFVTLKRGAK